MNMNLKNYRTERFNGNKPPGIRSLTNESGVALVFALLLMAVMITLVPASMRLTTVEMDRSTNFTDSRELFYLAEAGLEHGKSIVATNAIDDLLAGPDGDKTTLGDNGTVAGVGDTADATPF
ncbi:MAG: pilus assembly PilX N-terminal domain-containing protein, partial [Nitrospinaceae bacterium]